MPQAGIFRVLRVATLYYKVLRMTSQEHISRPVVADSIRADAALPSLPPGLAPVTMGTALLLGITGDALLHDGAGLSFLIIVVLVATSLVPLAWRAGLPIRREP